MKKISAAAFIFCMFFQPALAEKSIFLATRITPDLRDMIGKPLIKQAIDFSNGTNFVLWHLNSGTASFFIGGDDKGVDQDVNDLLHNHQITVLIRSCEESDSVSAKIAWVSVWEPVTTAEAGQIGSGMKEIFLSLKSSLITPNTLRIVSDNSRAYGPIFTYTNGNTQEEFSIMNDDKGLIMNWNFKNNVMCKNQR